MHAQHTEHTVYLMFFHSLNFDIIGSKNITGKYNRMFVGKLNFDWKYEMQINGINTDCDLLKFQIK